MKGYVCISLVVVLSCAMVDGQGYGGGVADSREDLEAALNYMTKYQGLSMSNDPNTRMSLFSHTDMASTIQNMQRYMGVPLTGRIDAATKAKMAQPRCGVPDPTGQDAQGHALGGRMRRYTHTGGKWEDPNLTFRILNAPRELRRAETDAAIRKAFKVWEDVTPLRFTEVGGNSRADIYLTFGTGDHGDQFPFDGQGATLAHAFPPQSGWGELDGDIHFDDDETFSIASYQGINLFQVAAHEIGHSLGLGHSTDSRALMAPFYAGYDANFQLPYDDQLGIQRIYGSKRPSVGSTTKKPQPGPQPGPDPGPKPGPDPGPTTKTPDIRCKKTYDAISLIRGELFAFQNDIYWRLRFPQELISRDIGELTSHFWQAFPNKIDAAYERFDHMIFFFKGSEYYKYNGLELVSGYPKPIKTLDPKLPGNLDAVISFLEYSKTYFIKGRKVWRFDELTQRVEDGYPTNIKRVFPGVPSPVSSAFLHTDGAAYFLKGYEYYRYNDTLKSVEDGYPRRFGVDFLGCDPKKLVQLGLDTGDGTGNSNINQPTKLFIFLLTITTILNSISQ